ncbi:MAG: hypothetical protein ACYSU1_06770 [Planctomycetota bacterium]|jgi:hypothetical protein
MRFLPCLALILVVLPVSGLSCSDEDSGPYAALPAAPLEASPAFLDLGSVTYGQRTSGTYHLRNASEEPLTISRIGPFSCQCVSAEMILPERGEAAAQRLDGKRINLVLQPQESMEIHFTLDTARYRKPASRKVGSIPVVFPDHPGVVLEWGADIWTPFAVEPWSIDMQEVGMRERPQGTAMVAAHDSDDFRLDVDRQFEDGWSVQSRQVSVVGARLAFELTFTAPEVLPEGPFQREFRLHTDLQDAPPVRVTVMGFAKADLSVSPSRIVFDPSRDRLEAQLIFQQRAAGADLSGLDLDGLLEGDLEIVSQEQIDPQRLMLQLRYVGGPADKGRNFTLEIPTDDPSTPVLEIPVTVMPQRGNS